MTLVFSSAGGQAYGPLTETWTIAPGHPHGHRLLQLVRHEPRAQLLLHRQRRRRSAGRRSPSSTARPSPVLVAGQRQPSAACATRSAPTGRRSSRSSGDNYADVVLVRPRRTPTPRRDEPARNGSVRVAGDLPGRHHAPDRRRRRSAGACRTATRSSSRVDGRVGRRRRGIPTRPAGRHAGLLARRHARGVQLRRRRDLGDDRTPTRSRSRAMDYDPATSIFSNFRVLYTPATRPARRCGRRSCRPTTPSSSSSRRSDNGRDWGGTRSTCDSQRRLHRTPGTQASSGGSTSRPAPPTRLDNLNGLRDTCRRCRRRSHTDDAVLNYEPTVNPVAGGGYAWVVFTSRRLYGNVATIDPYWSDPRYHDISRRRRPKKLWVAAIDLNAKPGHRPEPPGVLPARAGAPRRQLARLLGRRSVRGRTARRARPATSAAAATARTPTAASSAAPSRRRARGLATSAPPPPTAAASTPGIQCINWRCAQAGIQ